MCSYDNETINKTSIIITNYNGKSILQKCLQSVFNALEDESREFEVIVVDDCSTDGSVEMVKTAFPQVKIIIPQKNLGFQKASNLGVRSAQNNFVILINNDVMVEKGSLEKFLKHFKEGKDVFAVTGKELKWDRKTYLSGCRTGFIEKGHFKIKDLGPEANRKYSLFATGGAAAFDKEKFLALAGFDDMYYPLYWEDIDLCYRAWKCGWKTIYDPEIILYHEHQATILKLVKCTKLRLLTARNSYLFYWKNITDAGLIKAHLFWAPVLIIKDIIHGHFRFFWAFLMALLKLPQALQGRRKLKLMMKHSDREIFQLISEDL